MENNEETEMAYMAGLMDGDGSFSLCRKENGERSPLFFPLIQFGNICRFSADIFLDKFGGYINTRKAYLGKDNGKRKEFYTWKIDKVTKCTGVLEKLIPFLVIKKERAEFLLQYVKENPFKRGSNRLTDDVIERRQKSFIKMLSFNEEPMVEKEISRKRAAKNTQDPTFWAYMAGLMDTDGSFSISKNTFSPMIQLTMTDGKGINFIRKNCIYGTLKFVRAKSCKNGFCYKFLISGRNEVLQFVRFILPYLRIKKKCAALLLDYCSEYHVTIHRRKGLCEVQKAWRLSMCEELKALNLNQYGVYKPSLIDLEAQEQGNKAEGESHRERLNEMA